MKWDPVTEAQLSQAVQQIIPGQTDYASIESQTPCLAFLVCLTLSSIFFETCVLLL